MPLAFSSTLTFNVDQRYLELLALFRIFLLDLRRQTSRPITLTHTSVQGKAKKQAWKKLVDEGVTPEEAQSRYVELVEKLKSSHGYDEGKVPEPVGGS